MNLQVSPAALVETPVPPADDAVARALDAAKLSNEQALLDALEFRRAQILGLSFKSLDLAAHLAVGHSSKILSPARAKSPTMATIFHLLDALQLSVVLVNDPSKAAGATWPQRDAKKVRLSGAISAIAIERARPHVVAGLLRKARHSKFRGLPAAEFMQAMAKESSR